MYIPDYLQEVAAGVWERKIKGSSFEVYNKEHDEAIFKQILLSDKTHYNRLAELVKKEMPDLIGKYEYFVSIGGGAPKFEAVILKAEKGVIIDIAADWYEKQFNVFKEIYDTNISISYKKAEVKPKTFYFTDCVCFIHVLEHMNSWDEVKQWIALQSKDVIIYGPNIEAARDQNWHHYGEAVDHNVFFTQEAVKNFAALYGFKSKSFAYSDDFLIWLTK